MRAYHVLLGALGLLALARPVDASVLYGSTSAGGPGELWIINAANGTAVQDVGPLNDAGGKNYAVTGLAFDPLNGVLYGSTGNTTGQELLTIDPVTAQVTVVGAYNAFVASENKLTTMADIAFDSTGNLYGVCSVGTPNLYSIDINTGQATLIGGSGVSFLTAGGGLAISPGGVFYSTPETSHFGTYDPTTGAYTNITDPARPAGSGASYASLAFDGNTLYGMDLGIPTHLVTIDPAGNVTDLGPSVGSIDGIAFSVAKTWGVDRDGNFSVGANWLGGVAPGGIGDLAAFTTIITANRTVTVDADTTVGSLTFDSPHNYTLAGTHTLTLQAAGATPATINVPGASGNGADVISAPIALASDLNIVQNSAGTFTISGPLNDAAGKQINVSGSGTAAITGSLNLGNATALSVSGTSTLRFGLNSGTATIGTAVTATVNDSATLELAGSVAALSSGANRVNITNSSNAAAGVLVSGTQQQVGGIDGSGTTQVNAGSDLTANHIIQNALIIGGTAGSPALVTIAASDASGNPLDAARGGPLGQSSDFALADPMTPSGPFAAGATNTANLSSGDNIERAFLSTRNPAAGGNRSAVPEPSTLLLVLVAVTGVVGQRFAPRRRARHHDS